MRLRTALKICREVHGVPWESRRTRKSRPLLRRTLPQVIEAERLVAKKWTDLRFPLIEGNARD